jgi:hypothetical protein
MQYAQTGKIGNITAGEDAGITAGNYDLSGLEKSGLAGLDARMAAGQPEMYGVADQGIRDLMNTTPEGLDAMFSPYKALAEREGQTAADALKRNSGFAGNLYSSSTIRGLGDVAAKTGETNMATLAGLTEGALNRKAQAIGLAQTSGSLSEETARNRSSDALTYGGLERTLNNQRVEEANAEKLRRRAEVMGQLDRANQVSGANVPFGVESTQVAKPNPYMDFLQLIVSAGSQYAGAKAGAKAAA